MNRTRRFLTGISFGYSQQVLVMAVGLWLTPFLLKHIGRRDYGLWLISLQVLNWLTLADFGIIAVLPREIAYLAGSSANGESTDRLSVVVGETACVVLTQWPLVLLIAVLGLLLINGLSQELIGPSTLIVSVFVLTFPMRIFRAVIEGLQDFTFLGQLQVISWVTGILLTIALAILGVGIYALAIGWILTQLLTQVVCFTRLRRSFSYALPSKWIRLSSAHFFKHLGRGLWVSISQVAQVLVDGTDLSILGKTLGVRAVVPYSCTDKLVGVLSNQPAILMHAAAPGLSSLRFAVERAHLFRVVENLTLAMVMLSGGLATIILAVNRGFVTFWVGPQFYGGLKLTALLALCMLLRHWNSALVYTLFSLGRERRISITAVLDGLFTVIASYTLIRRFGVSGAPLGSVLGVLLISVPANIIALSRESGKGSVWIAALIWPWLWRCATLTAAAGLFSEAPFAASLSFPKVMAAALIAGVIYVVVMCPLILKSPLRAHILDVLGSFLSKVRRIAIAIGFMANRRSRACL